MQFWDLKQRQQYSFLTPPQLFLWQQLPYRVSKKHSPLPPTLQIHPDWPSVFPALASEGSERKCSPAGLCISAQEETERREWLQEEEVALQTRKMFFPLVSKRQNWTGRFPPEFNHLSESHSRCDVLYSVMSQVFTYPQVYFLRPLLPQLWQICNLGHGYK